MRGFIRRTLRIFAAQALAVGPDLINWIAGTALPVIPAPFNILVGGILNGIGKAVRDYGGSKGQNWKWIPV